MTIEKNTLPEQFDEQPAGAEALTQEEILMNERDLLQGLIDSGDEIESKESYERIQIKRKGRVFFEFRIRPLSEEDSRWCYSQATRYAERRKNQPKVEIETNMSKFRSLLIYTATVNEDRKKLWDSKKAQEHFNVLQGWEVVDRTILPGEKERVIDRINDISGYGDDSETSGEELAKNS